MWPLYSVHYKTGEFEDQICKCRWWRTLAMKSKRLKESQIFFKKKIHLIYSLGK